MTDRRPIFFCHIPKTAGTTVRFAMEGAFPQEQIVPNQNDIRANGSIYPNVDQAVALLASRSTTWLLRGHYHLTLRQALDNPVSVVILRDPIERSISLLKHMIGHGPGGRESPLNHLEQGRFPMRDNEMTRFLIGSLALSGSGSLQDQHNRLMTRPLDAQAAVAEASEVLWSIDILGLTAHLDHIVEPLAAVGVRFDPERRVNKARVDDLALTDRQMETIVRNNTIDRRVYELACELIDASPAGD